MLLLLHAGLVKKIFFGVGGGGWALINFWGFQGVRLFEVVAYLKVGAYSNKYST